MKNIARQYLCALCHNKITICYACDRGNLYCGPSCSQVARRSTLSRAGKKYQSNQRGKLKHAERQKRYRSNPKKIVTHHTIYFLVFRALLQAIIVTTKGNLVSKTIISGDSCHFCGITINKKADDGPH